jgi:hypothetical protein
VGLDRGGDDRRRTERMAPFHVVRVEVETELVGLLGGEARDLSRGGACVALDSDLVVGDEVILRLLFERYPNPIPATGRIVWTGPERGGAAAWSGPTAAPTAPGWTGSRGPDPTTARRS